MKKRRLDLDIEHLIELLLIGVFAAVALALLGLGLYVLLPLAQVWLPVGAPAALPPTATLTTPTPATSGSPTAIPTVTLSPLPLPVTPLPTLTPHNTPAPPATPTALSTMAASRAFTSFACDRPGWFPEDAGIGEHTIFQHLGYTYVVAAAQPERHALWMARTGDLCHWEELPPILTSVALDAWDGRAIASPFVIAQDGQYILLYTGITWNGTERILAATSTNPADAAAWVVQGEAFRPNHPEEKWNPGDAAICRAPMVLRDGDLYYLYYTGQNVDGGIIGVAVANAPIGPWEDLGAITPALPDETYESPFVIRQQDGAFYLFYHHAGQGTQYRTGATPVGPWSEPASLAPGWAHEFWQQGDAWLTSFLTNYSVTIFPLDWQTADGLAQPQIRTPSAFLQDIPIWAHPGEPAPHEVVLFRHTFELAEPLEGVTLNLFADTRYQAWLDGVWLGRGPARFSYRLREYDVYAPGRLEAGKHTLAVLVQWAPNTRRSESFAPFLQGHLQGSDPAGAQVIVRTNAAWKAQRSAAWQEKGVLVHSWGLIGPVELLDLSLLDAAWMQPGFNDDAWPPAVAINPAAVNYQPYQSVFLERDANGSRLLPTEGAEEATSLELAGAVSGVLYRPRSIAPLVDVPAPATVLDAGLLSPGFTLGELPPGLAVPYVLPFNVQEDTYFTIEAPGMVGPAISIGVDGEYVGWKNADETRPDVFVARMRLFRGPHQITFEQIPPTGLTFAVSQENVAFKEIPFSQGLHAGRRLLLAQPVSDWGGEVRSQVVVSPTQSGLTVTFPAAPSYLVLDLGRTIHGRVVVDVSGPAGSVLDVGWDERLLPGTLRPMPYPGSQHKEWNQTDSWVLDGNRRTLSTLDTRAGRYLLIAVWADQPVQLDNLRVLEERYPLKLRGSFDSSDPLLNYIWQVGVETLYPNMTDAYTDTPWRERGQWWGDAYVADHVNRVTFGDQALMRRGLLFMADSYQVNEAPGLAPNSGSSNMTDYMMLWVQNLADYVRLSGDTSILNQAYPVLKTFMEQMAGYRDERSGLIEFARAHWWDTAYVDTYGWQNRHGQSTVINALYYRTLLEAAYLAEQAQDASAAANWQQQAEKIRAKANEVLFSVYQQRYLATNNQGYYEPPTLHAQVWALAYGLVAEENRDAVTQAMLALLARDPERMNIGLYGLHWVFDALGQAGYIEDGLALIKTFYGSMVARGASTWWERIDADQVWTQSLSHAWGASPTWFLTTYVLGARATGPDTWELKPALVGVERAQGVLPLQHNDLYASWLVQECNSVSLTIDAQQSQGTILLPLPNKDTVVLLDDQVIWQSERALNNQIEADQNKLMVFIQGGSHQIDIQEYCP